MKHLRSVVVTRFEVAQRLICGEKSSVWLDNSLEVRVVLDALVIEVSWTVAASMGHTPQRLHLLHFPSALRPQFRAK